MLVPILGVPIERSMDLVRSAATALAAAGLSTDVVTSYNLQDIAVHLLTRTADISLVMLPSPGPDWHTVLRDSTQGYVYLHTETTALAVVPSPTALDLEGAQRTVETVRSWTKTLSSIVELQGAACTVIDVDRSDADYHFARHLEHRLGVATTLRLAEAAVEEPRPFEVPEGIWLDAGRDVLRPFDALRRGAGPEIIVTHAGLFFDGTKGAVFVQTPVPVPAEPANLFFGPYFYFPAGIWRVRAYIHLSSELAGRSFVMDVVTALGTKIATASTYSLEVGGERELSLEFKHQDWHAPVEVRFHCATPGRIGFLTLHRVEFVFLETCERPMDITIAAPHLALASDNR